VPVPSRPIPINYEPPTTDWGRFVEWLPEWSVEIFLLLWDNFMLLFLCVLTFLGWKIYTNRLRMRKRQIRKLWMFVLFFLTKRQMMIPLIIELAKKENALPESMRQELMGIREKCRMLSFRTSPNKRLELEIEVSRIFLVYFSFLESENKIHAGTKFAKIVSDLEYIDQKLIEMQHLYNIEAKKWNKHVRKFIGLYPRIALFKPMELFV
jgi:hypothetical protein